MSLLPRQPQKSGTSGLASEPCSWHCPTICQSAVLAAAGPGTGHNTQVLPRDQTHGDFGFHPFRYYTSAGRALASTCFLQLGHIHEKVSAKVVNVPQGPTCYKA